MLEEIFKRSLKSHLVIIVDSASTLTLRKAVVRIGSVFVVHSRDEMLIDSESHVNVSRRLSQKLCLEVFKLLVEGLLLQLQIELLFGF